MKSKFLKFKTFSIALSFIIGAFSFFSVMTGVFAQEPQFLFKIPQQPNFAYPVDVAVTSNNFILVADSTYHQIVMFNPSNPGTELRIGSLGNNDGQFNGPRSVAIDSFGNIYVADGLNHRIQKFTSTGTFITKWGSFGSSDGQFNKPRGIAVDFGNNIYIVDSENHRIQKFDSNGAFITKWGFQGTDSGEFNFPSDIVVDSFSNVFVADSINRRIQKFSSVGEFITKWGSLCDSIAQIGCIDPDGNGPLGIGDGQFFSPAGITTDLAGNVYVSDPRNSRIQKFTNNGGFITRWTSYGSGIGVDGLGGIYIAEGDTRSIRKFTSDGLPIIQWGSFGNSSGQFNRSSGIITDVLGNVYVADELNHRIQKFNSSGTFITKWGSRGSNNGQFNSPTGVAIDSVGNIYVVDRFNHRIQKFTSSGMFLTKWGLSGSGDSQFNGPFGIAIDSFDNIYITDFFNHRIQKFNNDGVFITKWGIRGNGDGQFNGPAGVGIDSLGNIYVADLGNHRIQKFTSTGTFITKWGSFGSSDGQFRNPVGIGLDLSDNIYVTEDYRIQKFTSSGAFLTKWGSFGGGDGQFNLPRGVVVDIVNNIYITDLENNRIQVFGIPIKPTLSNFKQLKSDGVTTILESSITTESTVVFKATISDSNNDNVKLQVELKEFSQPFNGLDVIESPFVSSGSEILLTRYGLVPQSYHWRARAIDSHGNASDWKEFGAVGNVDFIVDLPLSTRAAILAKELVSQPYLWGGKGWDYDQKLFATIDAIKTGYRYYNPDIKSTDIGIGVDCSGLIMWAYNRSFDPLKPRFNNFVKAEGADAQYNYNTVATTESELKPGDVMFFDWGKFNEYMQKWDGIKDGYIDHVAMYVGEGAGHNVVNALNRTIGIIQDSKDYLKQLNGFVAFKQVISALPPAVLISAHSPVDLIVTDPEGVTITPSTIISSDTEYLREIPRILYYSEIEQGADGKPIDQVYSYASKTGDYTIKVIPESGVSSTATYTLDFLAGGQSLILAKDVLISQIPVQGYGVTRSITGEISPFIPVVVDIKPDGYPNSINIGSKGVVPVAILSGPSFNTEDVVINSVMFAGARPLRGNFKDIDNDGDLDLVLNFDTQSLQLTQDSTTAILTGQLTDGRLIKGGDSVRIITNKKSFFQNTLTSLWLIISKTNIF